MTSRDVIRVMIMVMVMVRVRVRVPRRIFGRGRISMRSNARPSSHSPIIRIIIRILLLLLLIIMIIMVIIFTCARAERLWPREYVNELT